MDKVIKFAAGFFGVMLFGMGIQWLVDPAGAAGSLGMGLLDGAARSSQIGDFSAFFLAAGSFALLALITKNATLLLTPIALVGLAAVTRTLAWLVHDAALVESIGVELLMCVVFILAYRRVSAADK